MKTESSVNPATTDKAAKIINPEDALRILKVGTCPTLSGKSQLTYQVACDAKGDILLRIAGNTGGGFFNDDLVPFQKIQEIFDKQPADKPITSFVLHEIFKGRSVNTPSFLMAALKNEGLVIPAKAKQRSYDRVDSKAFLAEMKALVASKVSIAVPAEKPKAADQKAATDDRLKQVASVAGNATMDEGKVKPATSAMPVIKGKQYTAGKKASAKGKKK